MADLEFGSYRSAFSRLVYAILRHELSQTSTSNILISGHLDIQQIQEASHENHISCYRYWRICFVPSDKLCWSDVMLVERSELTSVSTWHAAGGFHTRNGDTNMAALQGYTIRLYKELEEITGMSCRMGGAVIETNCMVSHTNQRPDGTWDVVTSKGTIHAEHLVNAGGLWARKVAAMAGVYLPLHPMEHLYLVTEDIADIYNRASKHPHVMDPAGESYLRQEVQGLCIGFYEQPCKPWAVDGTPWDFGHELLPDHLDKVEDSIASAFYRIPVLEHAGIKSVIHGPFTFAPDGNPLVGPVPRVRKVIFGSIDCMIQRVSYTGDLEFEIYCTSINQTRLFMILSDAGKPHGIAPFGIRAMMSLRLDRHFGSWLSEFSPDYTAAETGVDRFIDFHKTTDFIGRHAANAERDTPPDRVLATFEVDADVVAYEPVFIAGAVQGFCTSGGYSHHLGKSIAMALIPRAHAVHGLQAKIEIMGQLRAANMVTTSGFDPDMQKMWS